MSLKQQMTVLLLRPVHCAQIRRFNSTEVKRDVTTGKRNDNTKTIACNDDNIIQSNLFILTDEIKRRKNTAAIFVIVKTKGPCKAQQPQ